MNNFEKIKTMDIEEMAEFIEDILSPLEEPPCAYCAYYDEYSDADDEDFNCNRTCVNGIKQWLETESEG